MKKYPQSYNPTGFAAEYNSWPPRRQAIYEKKIGEFLHGGPVTEKAHVAARNIAIGSIRDKSRFDEMRNAAEGKLDL